MTIQPSPTVERPAEQRQPLDPAPESDWRLRREPPAGIDAYPADWCRACGWRHTSDYELVPDYSHVVMPESVEAVISHLAYGPIGAELGLPELTKDWRPAHVETMRALVAELEWRIGYAEDIVARR